MGQIMTSIFVSVGNFALLPLPLFILMGEVMFYSGIGPQMIDALDKWVGRLPGRLSFEAVGAGALLATLTGSSMASVAVMGETLLPEMEKRGYQKAMSLGPILGAGGLAIMIPPSSMAVFLGWVGKLSIGRFLIAIILPGLLMAALYAIYIISRSKLQPYLAPTYAVPPTSLVKKLAATVRYILPIGLIIFLVTGVIYIGVATPSEAAATGAIGTFLLAAIYGKFDWHLVKKSIGSALKVSTMLFMIVAGATAFSQVLAFTGATAGMAEFVTRLPVAPIGIVIAMQIILLILGMFMGQFPIIMITGPVFFPVVQALGFSPLWFGVLFLLNMEIATTTPPFGFALFTMKGIRRDIPMRDIALAGLPFLYCDAIAMTLIIAFPQIALWLPGLMR